MGLWELLCFSLVTKGLPPGGPLKVLVILDLWRCPDSSLGMRRGRQADWESARPGTWQSRLLGRWGRAPLASEKWGWQPQLVTARPGEWGLWASS